MSMLAGLFKGGLGKLLGGGGKAGMSGLSDLAGMFGGGFEKIQGPARASVADDKGLKAQYDALDMTRANTGQGFNQAEKGNLQFGINKVNENTAARNNAITQNMASRGLGGSGMQTALKASAEQGGANSASAAGTMAQDQANARALDSISQLGSLGGAINEQAFNRGAAQDALNQFNVTGQSQGNQFMANSMMQNQMNRQNQATQRRGQNMQLLGSGLSAGASAYSASKQPGGGGRK